MSIQKINQVIAAIDLGSNSFHLSIVRVVEGSLQPLVKDKRMVRLAEGLDSDGFLSEEAMNRGIEVLKSFAVCIQELDASSVRVVATYTLRRARNNYQFLRMARQCMPIPIEIISGDEEARLIYQGVAHTTHIEGRRLVIDIGGGSTEFAIGEKFQELQLSSLPLGCLLYTGKYFSSGEITLSAFQAAEIRGRQRLEIIDQRFKSCGWDSVVGCSGTVKAIAQYATHNWPGFDGEITGSMLTQMRDELIEAGSIDCIQGVDEHRCSVLPAGLAILRAIFTQLDLERLTISESALREGVIYELTKRSQHQDIRARSVASFAGRYAIDGPQVSRIQCTALQLIKPLKAILPKIEWHAAQRFLEWAVQLHEVGLHINRRGIQRHSSYIIGNSEMPGFANEEKQILALLLRHYRKKFDINQFPEFVFCEQMTIIYALRILRLSVLLHLRRLDGYIPAIECQVKDQCFQLQFPTGWLTHNQLVVEDLLGEKDILNANHMELTFK